MKVQFFDIECAFEFVSCQPQYQNSAWLSLDTGEFYYLSGLGDSDELPEDAEDSDRYVQIPHKNQFDLGRELVRDFAAERLPDRFDEIEDFFGSRGAYARFKDLLQSLGRLEEWYRFENERTETALKAWCAENGIEVEAESDAPRKQ